MCCKELDVTLKVWIIPKHSIGLEYQKMLNGEDSLESFPWEAESNLLGVQRHVKVCEQSAAGILLIRTYWHWFCEDVPSKKFSLRTLRFSFTKFHISLCFEAQPNSKTWKFVYWLWIILSVEVLCKCGMHSDCRRKGFFWKTNEIPEMNMKICRSHKVVWLCLMW